MVRTVETVQKEEAAVLCEHFEGSPVVFVDSGQPPLAIFAFVDAPDFAAGLSVCVGDNGWEVVFDFHL